MKLVEILDPNLIITTNELNPPPDYLVEFSELKTVVF